MSSYDKLKEEFNEKVANLRETCIHPELTNWAQECWAIGHTTGYEVRYCKVCNKLVHRRINCRKCEKIIQDDEIIYGDGSNWDLPVNVPYCQECFDHLKEHGKPLPTKEELMRI